MTQTYPNIESLPLLDTVAPASIDEVCDALRDDDGVNTPVYPIGGGTSLDFGLPAKEPGLGLSLAGLSRVVDYPARDMTVTVQAGVTMARLAETLAAENQCLPVDVPDALRATIGAVVACGWSGPRQFGHGAVRDFVIGVCAVDGQGRRFRGGGRVVKNVAGYDFCKLLTGSCGILGVIAELTLRVKPIPTAVRLVVGDAADLDEAERLLATLNRSAATPAAVELLAGPEWMDRQGSGARIVMRLEGTESEVQWMTRTVTDELRALSVTAMIRSDRDAGELWRRIVEFSAEAGAPIVLRINVVPSAVTKIVATVREIDAQASFQSHAATGIVFARFAEVGPDFVTRHLIGRLQPAAARFGGWVTVLRALEPSALTPESFCGGAIRPAAVLRSIAAQFDAGGRINRGRFPV
jgi:glycolate oxidase FAD binding subunit